MCRLNMLVKHTWELAPPYLVKYTKSNDQKRIGQLLWPLGAVAVHTTELHSHYHKIDGHS